MVTTTNKTRNICKVFFLIGQIYRNFHTSPTFISVPKTNDTKQKQRSLCAVSSAFAYTHAREKTSFFIHTHTNRIQITDFKAISTMHKPTQIIHLPTWTAHAFSFQKDSKQDKHCKQISYSRRPTRLLENR